MKRKSRYTVSGPFELDHPVDTVGAGISCAQAFASKHRNHAEEVTYYVRDVMGKSFARVTKLENGIILSRLEGI